MKVIGVDNYDREHVADVLVESDLNKEAAENLARRLNQEAGENAEMFFKAVEDTKRLWRGMDDLV